jgi:hypothetical protein
MIEKPIFYVEKFHNGTWNKVFFTLNKSKLYCEGYVDAHDSFYPSSPMRIIKEFKDCKKIIKETKGRSKVTI